MYVNSVAKGSIGVDEGFGADPWKVYDAHTVPHMHGTIKAHKGTLL